MRCFLIKLARVEDPAKLEGTDKIHQDGGSIPPDL